MGRVFLAVFLLPFGQVERYSDTELAAEVPRLVRQLNDAKPEQRDAAEKALISLGPGVLSHLPPIDADTPVGLQVRLARVLQTLASHVLDQSAPATTVSLSGAMSLADALAELQKQTGNRVAGVHSRHGSISAAFVNIGYWQALDDLLDQAEMTTDPYSAADNVLTIMARPRGYQPRRGRADYRGPFRIEATGVRAVRDLRNPADRNMVVRIEVAWEPQLTLLYLMQPLVDVEARDENGGVLESGSPDGLRAAQVHRGMTSLDMFLPLQLPPRSVRKIASLKGTLTASILSCVETFEFEKLLDNEGQQKRLAGVTVALERIGKADDLCEVQVRMRFDQAADALQAYRIWVVNSKAVIIDRQGREVSHFGCDITRENGNEIGLAYTFESSVDPRTCKFVLRVPTLIVDTPIDYELKDIALP